ncbi:MAG: type III glutamate--ammonia ligase [Nitrospinota bacterium]|jgi:glutamine synthetase|nr:type III glutamate--ammonia ligase [Nitrospinota bacterium]HJM42172.1 type III glutamate--ammonia ligase [Nitrospinota bacterium]
MNKEQAARRLKQDKVEFILAQFVDLYGSAKVKLVPAGHFDDLCEGGAGFAGAAVLGLGQGPHSHDMMAKPDLSSYTLIPWKEGLARFACDTFVDDEPHPFCSRTRLREVLHELREDGYVLNVGMEPEHFLVRRGPDGGIAIDDPDGVDTLAKPCYDFKAMSGQLDYLRTVTRYMNGLGWDVYQVDHEDANGQYEINFAYADALITADRYILFKMMTSQAAKAHGCIATHMAKPFDDRTGSGAHFHFSIANARTGRNLFIDKKDPKGLGKSQFAYHFLGGLIHHARALAAVTSPTVNCYKRLQAGAALYGSRSGFTWTPAFITYGDNNRTQMFRTPDADRFEDRSVSAACNPYLAMAAYVKAGMDGVRKKFDPGEPNIGRNMYEMSAAQLKKRGVKVLPQNLGEALDALERDRVVQSALGEPLYHEFLSVKREEWAQYSRTVSQWEVDRFLTAL